MSFKLIVGCRLYNVTQKIFKILGFFMLFSTNFLDDFIQTKKYKTINYFNGFALVERQSSSEWTTKVVYLT